MTRTVSQTKNILVFFSTLVAGIVTAELFRLDSDQKVLDIRDYYVTLSTSALSIIHCGLLCVRKLGTCPYYVYDEATTTCYGRPNTAFKAYNPGELVTVASWSKMIDITHIQEEYRSCVLGSRGILVGDTTCIHVTKMPLEGVHAIKNCLMQFEGIPFEPRTAVVSEAYKVPMLERGFIESKPYWIGLVHNVQNEVYTWMSDVQEVSYTDWCTGNCSTSPPQPDEPQTQHCITTVFLSNNGPFGWWDKNCASEFQLICQTNP